MKKFIIFILLSYVLCMDIFAKGVTYKELEIYFNDFIEDFPALKFSGFFRVSDKRGEYVLVDTLSDKYVGKKPVLRGLHISHCVYNECDIAFSDYANNLKILKDSSNWINFTLTPECRSLQKVNVIDSNMASVGEAILRIIDDELYVYGKITFSCDKNNVASNISEDSKKTGIDFDLIHSQAYELVIKDSVFRAVATYPIDLDCIRRESFNEKEICLDPTLSNMYSFSQFFIFLAAQNPSSFYYPSNIYKYYKTMQGEIDECNGYEKKTECIYARLDRLDNKIKQNLIIKKQSKTQEHYKLLR